MPYSEKFEIAREKMLRANRALDEYLRNPFYNPQQEKQLADSLESAKYEFADCITSQFPEIFPSPSGSVPLDSAPRELEDARHECENLTLTGKEASHP